MPSLGLESRKGGEVSKTFKTILLKEKTSQRIPGKEEKFLNTSLPHEAKTTSVAKTS